MNDSLVNFDIIKNNVLSCIDNNVNTIILLGKGGNGKSYLIKELNDILTLNNYSVIFETFFHVQSENKFNNLLNIPEKKILEMHLDPFYKFNMNIPSNTVLIDMNNITF
tara:strand:+ start:1085 stop:1411 length:327 start_codon:yes stop_codon:yes gene_type:complete